MSVFAPIAADPYAWPYDGAWSPADTALIVIDMQVDFCKPGGYCDVMGLDVALTAQQIAPTERLLAACRARGVAVIHTREGHRADLADLNANKRWRSARTGAEIGSAGPCGRILTRGEPGWEIVPELAPLAGEPVVDKPGKGAFHATDFEQLLRATGVRNLIFAGVTSDCCVHTTMWNANDRGYECLLLDDASAALDERNHGSIVAITAKAGGQFGAVSTVDAVLAAMDAAALEAIELAVCGAHMRGLPLNHQLTELGATFVEETVSTPDYWCYALAGGPPARPGMVCGAAGDGAAIALEVWRLSADALGRLMAQIPAPLGIGRVTLADGREVHGFVCEAAAAADATEITALGGWRAYLDTHE